ncbi:MAG: hypothetical protein IJY88_05735 [Clostridia bacterium]|nr:hypothetical protein [Clostridia bacterium]
MKKTVIMIIALFVLISASVQYIAAEESNTVEVYINVSDKGELVASYEKISVNDVDGDGAFTINDALYSAHEALYDGGAEKGYSSGETDYGISIFKLWGDTSGSYGYYVNHASAWSLADPIKNGDVISAFVYKDSTGWSDSYAFFDMDTINSEEGNDITLTLSVAGYDEAWNPITLPLENAVITINGEKTEFITNEKGMVTFDVDEAGAYVISAESNDMVIVPPVCILNVKASDDASIENSNIEDVKPQPGDDTNILMFVIIAVVSIFAAMYFGKRVHER